jgi:hypothetical protein
LYSPLATLPPRALSPLLRGRPRARIDFPINTVPGLMHPNRVRRVQSSRSPKDLSRPADSVCGPAVGLNVALAARDPHIRKSYRGRCSTRQAHHSHGAESGDAGEITLSCARSPVTRLLERVGGQNTLLLETTHLV